MFDRYQSFLVGIFVATCVLRLWWFLHFDLSDLFWLALFVALMLVVDGYQNKKFFRAQYGCKSWPHKCALKSCKGWHRSHA